MARATTTPFGHLSEIAERDKAAASASAPTCRQRASGGLPLPLLTCQRAVGLVRRDDRGPPLTLWKTQLENRGPDDDSAFPANADFFNLAPGLGAAEAPFSSLVCLSNLADDRREPPCLSSLHRCN
jgi:hypothetical protein